MSTPRISVVIPTLNGKRDLEELLPVLNSQVVSGGHEILVIDSGSTDGTVQLCEAAGASVRSIPKSEFRHGTTRNLRAADAQGEVIVFLTQDALPRGERFLEALTAPLRKEGLVGCWARILPCVGDDPLTERTALAQPEAVDSAFTVQGDASWRGLSNEQRLARVRFNNVASAVRRDHFEVQPFEDVPFGEDLVWALAALDAGKSLRFTPEAVVEHAHRYSLAASFERNRVDAAFQRLHFDREVRSGWWSVVRGLGFEFGQDLRFILGQRPGGILHLLRSPFLRGSQVLGQLFGSRGWNPGSGEAATRQLN